MSILKNFWPPANQQDFPEGSEQQQLFLAQWNTNCDGWSQQGILGNPWNTTYSSPQNFYFNLLTTDVPQPPSPAIQGIFWGAFPNRINWYFNQQTNPNASFNLTQTQLWQFADGGPMAVTNEDGSQFFTEWPQIPRNVCSDPCPPGASTTPPQLSPYGPYGPRGWLDEYCEWSVTRNTAGKITRIDYTCENAEYWYTLWRIDPQTVCDLYRSTLNNQNIQLADLQLVVPPGSPNAGQPVIDPSMGMPAYNPLNVWNSGTVSTPTSGGAMHLTSTPNTLQTEMGLASGATVARTTCEDNEDSLICCSQYGQFKRNSDPHIGFSVNQLAVAGLKVALSNPPGLYIQMPDTAKFNSSAQLPPNAPTGAQAMDYFTIVRGVETLNDQDGNQLPTNCILHLVYEVPEELGFTVSDIQLMDPNGQFQPIQYAAQVSEYLQMGLNGTGISTTDTQTPLPCAGSPDVSFAAPLQMMYSALWDAYYNTPVNINGLPPSVQMNVASDTSMAAVNVVQGESGLFIAIAGATITADPPPTVNAMIPDPVYAGNDTVDDTITINVESVTQVNYATPGNSYPSDGQVVYLTVSVSPDSPLGLRDIQIINSGQTAADSIPARSLLNVVAASQK
jgi:hypothetical protein